LVEKIADVAPPSGLKRWLFRLPLAFYRAGLGWLVGSRFVMVEHLGRKSGLPRQVVLEVVDSQPSGPSHYVVAAWGEKADWLQNVKAHPEVEYQVGRHRFMGRAEILSCDQAAEVFLDYGRRYPRMLQELMRLVGYRIEADETVYRQLADFLPVVKLCSKG
jgi:deazaflavin-dependent oxidoreductase (nitroreductase family)